MWLKSEEMPKKHVKIANKKHWFIMYLIKKVGKRSTRMGLKIAKFHAIMHIATDILFFGVPMETDTGANESHHKGSKAAAVLTQKNETTFNAQVAQRKEEIHLLELANQEFEGRPLWDYLVGYHHTPQIAPDEAQPRTGGAVIKCFRGANGTAKCKYLTRCAGSHMALLETCLLEFVICLQECFVQLYPEGVYLRTEHERGGSIF